MDSVPPPPSNSFESSRKWWHFLKTPGYSRTLGFLAFFLILAAVPLTVYIAQQRQDLQQGASECPSTHTRYSCSDVKCSDGSVAPGTGCYSPSDGLYTTQCRANCAGGGGGTHPDGCGRTTDTVQCLDQNQQAETLNIGKNAACYNGANPAERVLISESRCPLYKHADGCGRTTDTVQCLDQNQQKEALNIGKNAACYNGANPAERILISESRCPLYKHADGCGRITDTVQCLDRAQQTETLNIGKNAACYNGANPAERVLISASRCPIYQVTATNTPVPNATNTPVPTVGQCPAGTSPQCLTSPIAGNKNATCYQGTTPVSDICLTSCGTCTYTAPTLSAEGVRLAMDLDMPNQGNTNPQNKTRNVTVCLYGQSTDPSQGDPVACTNSAAKKTAQVTWDTASSRFKSTIDAGNIPAGSYQVFVKSSKYLRKRFSTILTVVAGTQNYTLPQTTMALGDTNNDNKIDIIDFNMVAFNCYDTKVTSSTCTAGLNADLNDDGKVDGVDISQMTLLFALKNGD